MTIQLRRRLLAGSRLVLEALRVLLALLVLPAPLVLPPSILFPTPAFAQEPTAEYRLKAAIVSKFPEFAQWPAAVWTGRSTLEFCVLAPNPFGAALDDLLAGEQVDGHALRVRDVKGAADLDGCHVLFASTGAAVRARQAALARAATLPVLTISDDPDFLARGGIVGLQLVNGRVRFEIDVAAAGRAGIRLSSQLLQLALRVHGGPQ